MKIFLTGITGQLGYEVNKVLLSHGDEVIAPPEEELDLTDVEAVKAAVLEAKPDAIIHCAAYTAVDKAEDEPELARAINEGTTKTLARLADRLHAKMLYVSTDYVFDGGLELPYDNVDDVNPLNVYGHTKLLGELAVEANSLKFFIVRTSWVFGANGNNFVKTILRLADEKDQLKVVNDQIGSPTYAKDLAVLLHEIIHSEEYGFYHATNEGYVTFYDFAKEILKQAGKDVELIPVTSDFYGAKAVRPHNSKLAKDSLDRSGFHRLPEWQDALDRFLREIGAK